jgi:hypothetical protein
MTTGSDSKGCQVDRYHHFSPGEVLIVVVFHLLLLISSFDLGMAFHLPAVRSRSGLLVRRARTNALTVPTKLSGFRASFHQPVRIGGVPSVYTNPCSATLRALSAASGVAADTSKLVDYFAVPSDTTLQWGDYDVIASQQETKRDYTPVVSLNKEMTGKNVWIRGRVNAKRVKGNICFLTIRSSLHTVQTCFFNIKELKEPSKEMIKYIDSLPLESVVDIYGTVAPAAVKSCTQHDVELQIKKVFAVSRAPVVLPFLMEDAARSQVDIDNSQGNERPFSNVPQEMRLDNRWLDLRVPSNNAIMRIKSGVCALFREALSNKGFTEIITPKLIRKYMVVCRRLSLTVVCCCTTAGVSEGGANVFKTNYFDQVACLAQSPQLYKQMAISADLERVFEIGPVFRAENSHTKYVLLVCRPFRIKLFNLQAALVRIHGARLRNGNKEPLQ